MTYITKDRRGSRRLASIGAVRYEYEVGAPSPPLERGEKFIIVNGVGANKKVLLLKAETFDAKYGYYAILKADNPQYDWRFDKQGIEWLPQDQCHRVTGETPSNLRGRARPKMVTGKRKYVADQPENQEFVDSLMTQFEQRKQSILNKN